MQKMWRSSLKNLARFTDLCRLIRLNYQNLRLECWRCKFMLYCFSIQLIIFHVVYVCIIWTMMAVAVEMFHAQGLRFFMAGEWWCLVMISWQQLLMADRGCRLSPLLSPLVSIVEPFIWTRNYSMKDDDMFFLSVAIFQYRITQDYQYPSVRLNCHGWPSAGEKCLKLINTPSHSPYDGQASPCLNSHSTHIPIPIACSIVDYNKQWTCNEFPILFLFISGMNMPDPFSCPYFVISLLLFFNQAMNANEFHATITSPSMETLNLKMSTHFKRSSKGTGNFNNRLLYYICG